MAFNVQAAIAAAAEVGPDMNEAQAGGGIDFPVPAAGPVRLRFIGYVELGVHKDKKYDKNKELVRLFFELSGPKHPPVEADGKKHPQVITFEMTKSLNEKAGFYKLFKRMNHTGQYKHMAQMLGVAFAGTITHNESGEGSAKRTYANLYNADGFTIRPAFYETMDPETGDMVSMPLPVDEPLSPLKCFLWDAPQDLKEMWDSLFVDGKTDDKKDEKTGEVIPGKSKNWLQNKIKAAVNFPGSPIAELLFAGGEPDLSAAGGVTKPERSEENVQRTAEAKVGAAEDPLAAM